MKKLLSFVLSVVVSVVVAGCAPQRVTPEEGDSADKRPAIYISVFNGGYGHEWLKKMVTDYNQSHADNKYKIAIDPNKDEFNTISSRIQAGTFSCDMFWSSSNIYKLIDTESLEDISDVWDTKPSGEKTIRSLMYNSENYEKAYGDGKGGLYALPFTEAIMSFIYDHDVFLKLGLLFNESGSFITSPSETLSKGNDGISGTYDDGHPQTEAQWNMMVKKADNLLGNAFAYSGKFGVYLNTLYESIYAQYDGLDKYMLNYPFDKNTSVTYDFEDGNGETLINLENGFRLAEMRGRRFALDFIDKYLAGKDVSIGTGSPYIYPMSATLGYSHTDAQNDYILSNARDQQQKIAMLYDGDWWENEAKTTFNALKDAKYDDYAFRTRNYRFMTLPYFEGQAEPRNIKCYSIWDNMYVAMVKQNDEEKKTICKEFMSFMYKDEYIRNFTVESGGFMPYDVALTEDDIEKLSPFTKNAMELYKDKTNNKFFNNILYGNMYDVTKSGAFAGITSTKDNYVLINALYYASPAKLIDEMKEVSARNYSTTRLDTYRNYIANKV